MESHQLTINSDFDFCPECQKLGDILKFECGHNTCTSCYLKYWADSIGNLNKILLIDFTQLDGKAGSVGCTSHCEKSFVSIPPLWLEGLFKMNNLEELSKTVNFLATFLSGFRTYIYRCDKCRNIHSGQVRGECNNKVFKVSS